MCTVCMPGCLWRSGKDTNASGNGVRNGRTSSCGFYQLNPDPQMTNKSLNLQETRKPSSQSVSLWKVLTQSSGSSLFSPVQGETWSPESTHLDLGVNRLFWPLSVGALKLSRGRILLMKSPELACLSWAPPHLTRTVFGLAVLWI